MTIKSKFEKAIQLTHRWKKVLPQSMFRDNDFVVIKVDQFGFNIIVNTGDDVSKSLVMGGIYEHHLAKVMARHITKNTHFIDIGANIGFFSLLAATLAPEGKVYSFEPDPRNYGQLMASVYLNGCSNRVFAHNFAASDHQGEVLLTNLDDKNSGGRVATDTLQEHTKLFGDLRYTQLKSIMIDAFLDIDKLDMVKIDIEGYEPKAMKGMVSLVKKHHPKIFSEFAPSNLSAIGGTDPLQYLNFFTRMGYEISVIDYSDGGLKNFGADSSAVLAEQVRQKVHHIDLFMKWVG